MDDQLLGYLLNSLDEPARRDVEKHLEADPQARRRLDLLRRAVEPLQADLDAPAPPANLVSRTIGLVAEHMCRKLAPAPAVIPAAVGSERAWWRRRDYALAASLLVLALGLAGPALLQAHRVRSLNAQCQNNLRVCFTALETYHDRHGKYPDVAGEQPHDSAGMVVPILIEAGALRSCEQVWCPAAARKPSGVSADSVRAMDADTFARQSGDLNPSYAYWLGFWSGRHYHGPRRPEVGIRNLLPLMADAPSLAGGAVNSSNHSGAGQNVLFTDGNVKFLQSRLVGYGGDDIFVNKANKVGAGLDPFDTVLGPSASRP